MKPTSIIFLILSVILIACGLGVCFIAKNMADSQGVALFTDEIDREGNNIDYFDITDSSLTRISLKIKNADVNIYRTTDETRIELTNFPKNTYELNTNIKTISLDNTISLLSLVNITENNINFHGLRFYVNAETYKKKDKKCDIYINENEDIKIFDIDITDGDLLVADFNKKADYTVTIKSGNADFSKITTSSKFNVIVSGGNVTLDNTKIMTAEVEIDTGDFKYVTDTSSPQGYNITTMLGTVTVNDEDQGGEYISELPIAVYKTKASLANGNAEIVIVNNK